MKKNYLLLLAIIMATMLSVGLSSCSKNDEHKDEYEKTENISNQDPEGTIVLNMISGAKDNYYKIGNLGEIHIDAANNFCGNNRDGYYKIEFVTIGKTEGLGKISKIPTTGWAESAAVVPETGYMIRSCNNYGSGNPQYARIYVVDYLTSAVENEYGYTSGSNSGAIIKYQAPLQNKISLNQNSLTFPCTEVKKCLKLEYSTHLNVKEQPDWCYIQLYMDSVIVNVSGNMENARKGKVVLTNATGDATITIDQEAVEPIMLETNTLSFTNKASSACIKLKTSTNYRIDSIPDWCAASIHVDSLVVSIKENTSAKRTGKIVIKNSLSKATINITQAGFTFTGSGTQTDPYNVQSIIEIVSALEVGVTLEKEMYVKGYVTNIPSNGISANYNNATFYISDDVEGKNRFYVYRAKGLGGKDITDENFIIIGDEVVICGSSWVNYQGKSPETSPSKAYVYSINGKTDGGGDIPSDVKTVSVAEFIAAPESNTQWYQLSGTVRNLKDGDQYGNFDLEDSTGSVYVYGLFSEKGGAKAQFQNLATAKGIDNGKKITIVGNRGSYKGKIEVQNAYYVSISN